MKEAKRLKTTFKELCNYSLQTRLAKYVMMKYRPRISTSYPVVNINSAKIARELTLSSLL